MKKSITILLSSMVVIYLLVAFVTLHIDFRLWTQGTRLMYALLAPCISALITMGYYENNKQS